MAIDRRTRILIVDDSAVMRSLLRSVVCSDARLEVAGTAADGSTALAAVALEHPDLVLLDVEMPVMDGLVTLRQLRARGQKMPVIMCSSLTQRGAKVTIEALASGASDYVAKPASQPGREEAQRTLAQELLQKIHALTSRAERPPVPAVPSRPALPLQVPSPRSYPITSAAAVLAIGVSTGGPAALDLLLPALPPNFPLPILVVQHMPEVFTHLLAERLNERCSLRVREASEGDAIEPGNIYIARGNWHMEAVAATRPGARDTIHLNQNPPENHCRPAVDVLFRSVARIYGSSALAVILTGMGYDGLSSCRLIRQHGGIVLAQDQATSTVWGMPGAVAQAGLAHKVLPLPAIAPEIVRICTRASSSNSANSAITPSRRTVS